MIPELTENKHRNLVSSNNTWPMILYTLTEQQTDSEVMQRVLMNCIGTFRTPRLVIPFAYTSI